MFCPGGPGGVGVGGPSVIFGLQQRDCVGLGGVVEDL